MSKPTDQLRVSSKQGEVELPMDIIERGELLGMVWANEAGISINVYDGTDQRRVIEIVSGIGSQDEYVMGKATIEKHNRDSFAELLNTRVTDKPAGEVGDAPDNLYDGAIVLLRSWAACMGNRPSDWQSIAANLLTDTQRLLRDEAAREESFFATESKSDTLSPTTNTRQRAREIVIQWREANDWPGLVWSARNLSDEPRWLAAWADMESRIASALSTPEHEQCADCGHDYKAATAEIYDCQVRPYSDDPTPCACDNDFHAFATAPNTQQRARAAALEICDYLGADQNDSERVAETITKHFTPAE